MGEAGALAKPGKTSIPSAISMKPCRFPCVTSRKQFLFHDKSVAPLDVAVQQL
jgi:hypothetical protein